MKKSIVGVFVCLLLLAVCSCNSSTSLPDATNAQKSLIATTVLSSTNIMDVGVKLVGGTTVAGATYNTTTGAVTFTDCDCTYTLSGTNYTETINGNATISGSGTTVTMTFSSCSYTTTYDGEDYDVTISGSLAMNTSTNKCTYNLSSVTVRKPTSAIAGTYFNVKIGFVSSTKKFTDVSIGGQAINPDSIK